MRFLSSSALASAEKFRLAASCSAAETMACGSGCAPKRRVAAYMGIRPPFYPPRPWAAKHARAHQRADVDHVLEVDLAGVDRFLHLAEVHLVELLGKNIGEAALGQPAVERHLAALEPLDAHARTRGLALAAAA